MPELDAVAKQFAQLFEAENIPYALMGGLAVRAYALPRATFDVDFTIQVPRAALPRLYDLVDSLGYAVPESQRGGWVDNVRGLPVIKFQLWAGERAIDIDVFLAETEFQQSLLQRRKWLQAESFSTWLVSPEDLIVLKLIAGRPKDLVDIADVLFVQGALDEDYMRAWANKLGVGQALETALRDKSAD